MVALFVLVGTYGSVLGLTSTHSSTTGAPPLRVFIGGLGYCGSRIAQAIRNEFPECHITGTVRSQERRRSALGGGVLDNKSDAAPWNDVHVLDLNEEYVGLDEAGQASLREATHVIQTVAPIADFDKDPLLALHGDILLGESLPNHLSWVGYLSSTGVYGNHDGAWVDEEDSELLCVDAKSLARITAEEDWKALEVASAAKNGKTIRPRIDCFRCGGIYGPGRGPLFAAAGKKESLATNAAPPPSETPKYVNRILVDDICGALIAAIKSDRPLDKGRVYNLVDDDPAPRREVVLEARKLRGLSDDDGDKGSVEARASTATPSRRRAPGRNTGNKRCRNDRLKADYGWTLVAPTFREGLAKLHNELGS